MLAAHFLPEDQQQAWVDREVEIAGAHPELMYWNLGVETAPGMGGDPDEAAPAEDELAWLADRVAFREPVILQTELAQPLTRETAVDQLQRLHLPHALLLQLFGWRLRYRAWRKGFEDPVALQKAVAWQAWRELKVEPFASVYLVTSGLLDALCSEMVAPPPVG